MFKDAELNKFVLYSAITGILIISMACILQLCFVPGSECKLPFITVDETEVLVFETAPDRILEDGADYQARIYTNMGDFSIDLYEQNAPNTVNNFVFLVSKGYYDGVKFHRIFPDLLIQTGDRNSLDDDPDNDGMGGPGYSIDDEINWASAMVPDKQQEILTTEGYSSTPNLVSKRFRKYALAMANAGNPNTNGSQFFITLQDEGNTKIGSLRGRHTVFGIVTSGYEVVDKISQIPVNGADTDFPTPKQDVYIKTIEVTEILPNSNTQKIIAPDQTVKFD
jgi:cyclophilin family peptidyl-prolyl cis-trans isomerase